MHIGLKLKGWKIGTAVSAVYFASQRFLYRALTGYVQVVFCFQDFSKHGETLIQPGDLEFISSNFFVLLWESRMSRWQHNGHSCRVSHQYSELLILHQFNPLSSR